MYWYLFLLLIIVLYLYRGLFLLNDVTTTPENPPRFEDPQMAFTEKTKKLNKLFYNDLSPYTSKKEPEKLYTRALKAAKQMPGWEIIEANPSKMRIEAVARTKYAGFEDDVLIEIRYENEYSSLHIRSKSRLGKGDLGTNYRRIKHYIEKLKQETS